MVNACTPQGEPILGTGGEKKYVHWFHRKFKIAFTSGKKCRSLEKVHSSDDGILLPLAMGGGGKEKSIYVHTNDCTICRRLLENVVAAFTWNRNLGKSEAKHPIEPHFSQHFPSYPEL